MRPVLVDGTLTVRGCTTSSSRSVHSISRRTRPSGSARTVRTGPTGITPRRRVGIEKSSVWRRPSAGSAGRAPRRRRRRGLRAPTRGCAVSRAFCTLTAPRADSPTTARRCGSTRLIRYGARPMSTSAATRASASDAQPATTSSTHPSRYPKPSAVGMRASTTQPIGVMTPLSRRPTRTNDAADRTRRAHGADDRVGEDAGARTDEPGTRVGEPGRLRLRRRIGATPRRVAAARRHTACRSLGGGVSSSSCAMMLDGVTPSNSASGSSTSRCESTASASDLMSSGTT